MRHKSSKNKLSRSSSQRKALLRNLVSDTIKHGKITTTKARAKEAKPILEKMITIAKTKDFNSIRKVSEFITDKKVINDYNVVFNGLGGIENYTCANRAVFIIKEGVIKYRWDAAPNPGVEPDYNEIKKQLENI